MKTKDYLRKPKVTLVGIVVFTLIFVVANYYQSKFFCEVNAATKKIHKEDAARIQFKIYKNRTIGTIDECSEYKMLGVIVSQYSFNKVNAYIVDDKNKIIKSSYYFKDCSPKNYPKNKVPKIFSMKRNINTKLGFSKLRPGRYTLKIKVKDRKYKSWKTYTQNFRVKRIPEFKVTNVNIPGRHYFGKNFIIGGIINSKTSINQVSVRLYRVGASKSTDFKFYPRHKTFALKQLNSKIKFNKLKPGRYDLKVYASNKSNIKNTLISKRLTISNLKIVGLKKPTMVKLHGAFTVEGKIHSHFKLKKVIVGIKNKDGKFIKRTYKTVYPNQKTYDINQIDNYILFGIIKEGTYTYCVYAQDTQGAYKYFAHSKFQVYDHKKQKKHPSVLTIRNMKSPTYVKRGGGFTVRGDIRSYYKLKKVKVGIKNRKGYYIPGTTRAVYPNSNRYDINRIDKYINFSIIPVGQYTYCIYALDSKGVKKVFANKKFSVYNPKHKVSSVVVRKLKYNKTLLKKMGRQVRSGPCGLYSMAYGRLILDGKLPFKESKKYEDILCKEYGCNSDSAHWWKAYAESIYTNSPKIAYQNAIDEIKQGRPVIIPLNNVSAGTNHFITLIGYVKGTSKKNVTIDHFVALDSVFGGEIKVAEVSYYFDTYYNNARYIRFVK